jgi:hypothetical protein
MQDGGSITAVEAKYILTTEIRNLLTQNAKWTFTKFQPKQGS